MADFLLMLMLSFRKLHLLALLIVHLSSHVMHVLEVTRQLNYESICCAFCSI